MPDLTAMSTPLFLFSLPRSGSTLCQRILAAHKDIATVSEPHILLHFIHSLTASDIYSKYDHQATSLAIREFCHNLPNGVNDYLAEMGDFVVRLYAKASQKEVKYFLDKTPKYNSIAEDVINLFPEAKFIIIWRNPLSVISSIMETWSDGRWNLYHLEFELFHGLDNLISAYQKYADKIRSVLFEDLILNPEATWRQVFAYLELPFDPEVLTNFAQVELSGHFRDPNADLKQFQVLRKEPLDKWKRLLTNPLRKAWCRHYLRWIGQERLAVMGYNLEALIDDLNALPSGMHFLGSDIYRMPYGAFYRVFEFRIMKHKLQAWCARQHIYMHK